MKKIVIVGAGIAGLSVAVYKMHTIPGGECTGWTRKGYHVDNCIHWLMGTKPGSSLYEMWRNLDAINNVELYTAEAHEVHKVGDVEVHMYSDIERLRLHLKEISSEDTQRIDEYCDDILISLNTQL
ncbi:MAG: hypothetical protein RR324_03225 [Cellulosilyticaceae bacterium]